MVARAKNEWSRLKLSKQIRIDREVYEEFVRRAGELQATSGRGRVSFNDVLREVLMERGA